MRIGNANRSGEDAEMYTTRMLFSSSLASLLSLSRIATGSFVRVLHFVIRNVRGVDMAADDDEMVTKWGLFVSREVFARVMVL